MLALGLALLSGTLHTVFRGLALLGATFRGLALAALSRGRKLLLMTTVPSCPEFDVPNDEYRVVLLRRLRLPLPLRRCRCGGRLDALGDHRSACAQVGVLAHRAGPLERAAAPYAEKRGRGLRLMSRCAI